MAQYKVPQDVEAEDKLLGPFTFRQFVYLMIAGLLIAAGVFLVLHNLAILLIIIAPPVVLLLVLALPIKKDQPMETYLSAVISYYLKPRTRIWEPGEAESTIIITAPKQSDEIRTKDLDQDEAMHRLSFLADIVDTEGYAIKDSSNSSFRADVIAETNNATDMFEENTLSNDTITHTLETNATNRHDEMVNQMRAAIDQRNQPLSAPIISHTASPTNATQVAAQPIIQPAAPTVTTTPIYTTAEPIPVTSASPAPTYAQPTQPPVQQPITTPAPVTPAPIFGTLDADNTAVVSTPIFTSAAEQPPALPANPLQSQPVAQPPVQQPVQTVIQQPITQPVSDTATVAAIAPATPPEVTPLAQTVNPVIEEAPEQHPENATALENPLSADKIENNDTIIKPDASIVYQPPEEETVNPDPYADEPLETDITETTPEATPAEETPLQPIQEAKSASQSEPEPEPSEDMINLANNTDFSIETIAKQAKRINEKSNDKEVYISLH